MLISRPHRLIYLKTKKTGGTSVEAYLERACAGRLDDPLPAQSAREEIDTPDLVVGRRSGDVDGARWWNHMPAKAVQARLGEDWSAFLKVCCVRDPFDKVVSGFWMWTPAEERAQLAAAPFDQVRERFARRLRQGDILMPDREVFTIDGRLCVDRVIRYERLAEDLAQVCEQVGLEWRPDRLPAYKRGRRMRGEPAAAYYDARSERIVREAFDFEFETFGYR